MYCMSACSYRHWHPTNYKYRPRGFFVFNGDTPTANPDLIL